MGKRKMPPLPAVKPEARGAVRALPAHDGDGAQGLGRVCGRRRAERLSRHARAWRKGEAEVKKPSGALGRGYTKLGEEHCIGRAVVDQLCGEVYREEHEAEQERHADGYDDDGYASGPAQHKGYTRLS